MNSFILNRAQGSIKPLDFHVAQTTHLIRIIEPSPRLRFSCTGAATKKYHGLDDEVVAHRAGVNVLAIDHHEARYLVSGGADPTLRVWDLEDRASELDFLYTPAASTDRALPESAHTRAITSISIYPFDPIPSTLLSTSRDKTLKLSAIAAGEIIAAHTFDLHATPYSHSLSSHPGSTLLTAVGTSERSVRLLDLRSGLATHSLPGHDAAVLSVAWAPHKPHILASASADNRVFVFDVRRAGTSSAIATLDMDDCIGVTAQGDPFQTSVRHNTTIRQGRAHNGAVTGVRWTSNGSHIVTAGQDSRLRVWNSSTGANTLVHFGPRVRNSMSSHLAERVPLILPTDLVQSGRETLLWPNFNDQDDRGEILMLEIREGEFVKQLKVPGLISATRRQQVGNSSALSAGRINALAWRGNGCSGEGVELFSAHGDGTIRTWASRVPEDELNQEEENELQDRKRKRDVLEEIYQGLTSSSVTFT